MIVITYPLPFDQWATFKPFVKRFTDTFKEFPPECDYQLHASCCWGEPTDEVKEMFYGTKTVFSEYYANGCDLGSAQVMAHFMHGESEYLMLNMTTRCYFHRKGWGRRYLDAWLKHGPGLYGASCSHEGGKLHVCTRAYALDAWLFDKYPHLIDTREKGQMCETGKWCLTEWVQEQGYGCWQVTWDGERRLEDSRNPNEEGIYRRGNQQAMVVFDKHSDAFRDADEDERVRLTKMADGETKDSE